MPDSCMYLHNSHGRTCYISQAYKSNLRKPAFPLHQTHEGIVGLLVKIVRLTLTVSTTCVAKSRTDAKATAESQFDNCIGCWDADSLCQQKIDLPSTKSSMNQH
jgi:hypothetical protein